MKSELDGSSVKLEYFIDLQNKQIIVGQFAVARYSEEHPKTELSYLPKVLVEGLAPNYPKRPHYKKERGTMRWSKEECANRGKFLVGLLEDEEVELDLKILGTASQLGLIASPSHLRSKWLFGSIDNFYQAIELNKLRKPGRFNAWTHQDFIQYINDIAEEMGDRPTQEYLWNHVKSGGHGPSPAVIAKRFGSLRKALEQAGFPNIYAWEKEDYVNWGVKFMEANNGWAPTYRLIDYISKRKRGPSPTTVSKHFGGVRCFQAQVIPAYDRRQKERALEREEKIYKLERDREFGRLPATLFAVKETDNQRLVRVAKYRVAQELLPDFDENSKLAVASRRLVTEGNQGFINTLINWGDGITAGKIETTASYLGVFDDIWPMDEHMRTLHIPSELLSKAA